MERKKSYDIRLGLDQLRATKVPDVSARAGRVREGEDFADNLSQPLIDYLSQPSAVIPSQMRRADRRLCVPRLFLILKGIRGGSQSRVWRSVGTLTRSMVKREVTRTARSAPRRLSARSGTVIEFSRNPPRPVILSPAVQDEGPLYFVLPVAPRCGETLRGATVLRFLRAMKRVLHPERRVQDDSLMGECLEFRGFVTSWREKTRTAKAAALRTYPPGRWPGFFRSPLWDSRTVAEIGNMVLSRFSCWQAGEFALLMI
jgi:hypothetical protein